jgi:hypothetical protein
MDGVGTGGRSRGCDRTGLKPFQIAASTILMPFVLAAGAVRVVMRAIEYSRESRIRPP